MSGKELPSLPPGVEVIKFDELSDPMKRYMAMLPWILGYTLEECGMKTAGEAVKLIEEDNEVLEAELWSYYEWDCPYCGDLMAGGKDIRNTDATCEECNRVVRIV